MKYSQIIGVTAGVLLIIICYMPWSYIASKDILVTGMHAEGTNFGRPGLLNIFFTSLSILFFLIPKVWAKRTNVFFAAMNLAWSLRNYILISTCTMGDCAERRYGIYVLLVLSFVILFMTFFPKIKVNED